MEKPESDFEKLYKNECIANIEKTFPLIQKCIEESSNETEILRAVELSFEFGLKVFPVDELEKQIFQYAGRAAKTIFIRKLESLEKVNQSVANPNENYYQLINSCTEIISLFITIFMQLNDFQILTMSQVESLLLYSAEISYECFCHCNKSEEVYGSSFSFITKYLTTCFKKCCEMLELLLNFLTDKLVCEFHGKREVHILGDILMHISKCAIILMNLDVKTMAKVWKTHVGLLEKYFDYVKEDFNIAGTITYLCEIISFDADSALWNSQDDQEFNRKIKLACFNLKLVIKYCEIFSGCLSNCQKSLLSLLLKLCRLVRSIFLLCFNCFYFYKSELQSFS